MVCQVQSHALDPPWPRRKSSRISGTSSLLIQPWIQSDLLIKCVAMSGRFSALGVLSEDRAFCILPYALKPPIHNDTAQRAVAP